MWINRRGRFIGPSLVAELYCQPSVGADLSCPPPIYRPVPGRRIVTVVHHNVL